MNSTKDIFWYIAKLVILVFVALCSLVYNDSLFSVLLNTVTFLITILFDVTSAAVKVSRSILQKVIQCVVKVLALFIVVVFLSAIILTFYVAKHPDANFVSIEFIIATMIICAFVAIISDYIIS